MLNNAINLRYCLLRHSSHEGSSYHLHTRTFHNRILVHTGLLFPCIDAVGITCRLEIMLQIFAIILFSNSVVLFSQLSATILTLFSSYRIIHSLVPKLEQGTLEVDIDMSTLIHQPLDQHSLATRPKNLID